MVYRVDSINDLPPAIIKRNPHLLTVAELIKPKAAKYHNKKTTVDGIVFDSKREASRYRELKMLKAAGEVKRIELQPRFLLQDGFIDGISGKWVKKMEYVADFKVTYSDRVEIEDVKSPATRTKSYLIKRKLFRKLYPGLIFREVD